MKKHLLLLTVFLFMSFCANAQYTSIPDSNFEQELINDGHDSQGTLDGQILTADVIYITTLNITGTNKPQNQKITNLTGIQDFIGLEHLYSNDNLISQIDLTQNTNLLSLRCNNNLITALDLTNNSRLNYLSCINNQIQYLDLSNVGNLHTLNCRNNDLSYLDISNGFNSNMIFYRSDGNPNLQCVTLDSQVVVNDWNNRTDTPATFQVDASTTFNVDCPSAFITTWKTDNPGNSNDNSITIPTNGSEPYNFTVNWGDDTVSSNVTSSITHQYATAGTYTVTITGDYPWFWSGNTGDKDKLLSVDQWGDQIWFTMDSSFYGCSNVVINATDTPNLSQVTSFYRVFRNAPAINQPVIGTWDVSTITNMEQAFTNATTFNQDLSSWDMSNVTTTNSMFNGASAFNQGITNWVVGNVTNMAHMFRNAVAFNQPIGNWNVSNVTLLNNMFEGGVAFNQDISGWVVNSVNNMSYMFSGASAFNQDISSWDVSSVTNMAYMFSEASVFNQDISAWDVSSVTTMQSMFNSANNFNQNLGEWIIGSIESGTYEYDHDFYIYSLSMNSMFSGTNMSVANYDNTLIGWRNQPNTPRNMRFLAIGLNFCISESARSYLINSRNWQFFGDGKNCLTTPSTYFISTWETTTANETITIPTTGEGYNYDIDWDNDGVFDDLGVTGNATHTYTTAGTHIVSIRKDFPRIYFNNTGDKDKIRTIEQWGAIAWKSMEASFYGCTNLAINAMDNPKLSQVTSLNSTFRNAATMNQDLSEWNVSNITNMSFMFSGATAFNQNIDSWNVSNVTDMSGMFLDASAFNKNISNWNVSQVTNMATMFENATAFNQNINSWDVSSVTDMSGMFLDASAFNGNISNWNVSQVTNMATMFKDAASFNQDIGNWNTSNVAIMERMFENATAFDQDLGNWDISSIGTSFVPYYSLANMFNGVTLSLSNYDSLLMGWNTLSGLETNIPSDLLFSGGNSKYCSGQAARTSLISTYDWDFTDAGIDCSTLGLNEDTFQGLLIYPNPVINNVTITLKDNASFTLLDLNGRQVKKGMLLEGNNLLDLSILSSGVYIMKLKTDKHMTIKKIIKE